MTVETKGGRPKADNPRNRQITIRVTESEYARLTEYSKQQKMTITQVLLEGLNKIIKQ